MRSKNTYFFAFIVLGCLLAAAAHWRWMPSQLLSVSEPITNASLQTKAVKACLCERSGGKSSGEKCWADYENDLRDRDVQSMATACAPVSTRSDCFTVNGKEDCVTTGYSVFFDPSIKLCTENEAKAIELVFEKVSSSSSPAEMESAQQASRDIWQAILAGKKPAVPKSSKGCV
jgi:hypothetical protein